MVFASNPAGRNARKVENRMQWQRLCRHKWILTQEHERRFRTGMREVWEGVRRLEADGM